MILATWRRNPARCLLPPIAICIPVRDEAAGLPALLDGLARQEERGRGDVRLCVFLDGCSDGSAAILREAAPGLPFAMTIDVDERCGAPNAGRARGAAMALGLAALDGSDGILLTTDADSVPARDWIARCRDGLAVADVVAGRIHRQQVPPCAAQDRIETYYDRLHALRRHYDPVPWEGAATHHCTGGANLAFRASAYRALGGFAPIASGEDARIVDDASRAGLRVRRDAASIVHTSARRTGRAAGGLAAALERLDRGGAGVTVGHPGDAAWQYRRQAAARAAFARGTPGEIGGALGLSADHAIGVARDCPNAEAFAMRIVPAPPGGMRQVTIDHAEAVLAALEAGRLDVVA